MEGVTSSQTGPSDLRSSAASDASDAPASAALLARARTVTPGGVNSPVRAFRAVGGTPRFMVSGEGAWLTDADGRYRLDAVPAGTYTVVGWYEGEARVQRSVTVPAGGTVELDLEVP